MWRQKGMTRYQILVPSTVARLIAAEASDRSLYAPHPYLFRKLGVDPLNNVGFFNYELERHYIASRVYTLVSACATDESRLFGVISIGFRDSARVNKGCKQVAFYGSLGGVAN